MLRLALALCLGLASGAIAQENKKYFYTVQECYPSTDFMQMVIQWGEKPLFTGAGVTLGPDGQSYGGAVMFFTNQDTGTWTLGTIYADGKICINAAGTTFEPYTD